MFPLKQQAEVNAIHGAALAAAGKFHDALKYTDAAAAMDKRNEGLQHDLELLRQIVKALA